MMIGFKVDGAPFGKQRPRFTRQGHVYTPKETVDRERIIKAEYKRNFKNKRFPDKAVLKLEITAYMPIPKNVPNKKAQAMLSGEILPNVKPDWDNIGKLVSDALNGLAYGDDKQIASATITKIYSNNPCVVIEISEI